LKLDLDALHASLLKEKGYALWVFENAKDAYFTIELPESS